MIPQQYAKEMPGANTIFRPGDLASYAGRAWDIRISIGNAPVDEAYFFSVDSLEDAARPIRELLEEFALNPDRENELDIDGYPDLPFLQQELIQCYEAGKQEQFALSVFVNHCPEPADVEAPAKDFLAACVFRDKSWDYLVLDLVFEVGIPIANATELELFCERYAQLENTDVLRNEARSLSETYEKFASVSVAPCALGVPNGFDVRLQLMEYDGLDPERCVLLVLLHDQWLPLPDVFELVRNARAFQTHFSVELLEGLKACGKVFENA